MGARLFPLSAVRIDGGPCRDALEIDRAYLLKLNPDALMHHLRRNAGLQPLADHYGGWDANGSGILGHYLSACAQMYAATGDEELRRRVDHMIDTMAKCQAALDAGALYAYRSDVRYFTLLRHGELLTPPVNGWYVTHKLMAGARDAYFYTGSDKARQVWLALCDWTIEVTAKLSDEQWQRMLDGEHGAPHEVLADAYAVTGDRKYLDCALKFRHARVFDPVVRGDTRVLNGLHANTTIAKFLGYQRLYELTGDAHWNKASTNFWQDVVEHRSWVNGGNSQWEAFFDPSRTLDQMRQVCGPETCNSYNMLKLTAHQFELQPDAKQIDFYERCLFNHILSTQNPEHGGYVYYTPMRPGAYRTTSTDFDGFWCCVGTGMENHARYGELIYAHANDAGTPKLYVNLFIPSTLDWRDAGLKVQQTTDFPNAGQSSLKIRTTKPTRAALNIRWPAWAATMTVRVNDQPIDTSQFKPDNYVLIDRTWSDGDRIDLDMPMHLSTETLQGANDYAAVLYGPTVLIAGIGRDGLGDEDFRPTTQKGNMLARKRFPETDAPAFVASREQIVKNLKPVDGKPLTFTTGTLTRPQNVTLTPMWTIGDQRYVTYFRMTDEKSYADAIAKRKHEEAADLALDQRTIDRVRIGEQQSEADHGLRFDRSNTGRASEPFESWRDAKGFFSYSLNVAADRGPLAVRCVYWGSDAGRTFDILVDDQRIATQTLDGSKPNQYFDATYDLPAELIRGKISVVVRFEAKSDSTAGGVFDVRIVARQ
ncbi:MAG: glycoside hydrolase family 127 protein [Tepidisphaeraceae bacterium]